ncbi:hypothetical protein [Nocardiopsis sp. NRRL B-16309]|uniref:hypothetical protein n=1 Tax=Nocardiopsis sp. NRRL B-16309 TaxID=1519494 RepID=UPI0006ADD9C8|nr:hypothetical protein [Nocardiopsis sp. NRRL B-16309]KOX15773.1 hypothetical protein ADL05_14330 [Nocardiopsis sp. NRRL B-16309]
MPDGTTVIARTDDGPPSPEPTATAQSTTDPSAPGPSVTDWMQAIGAVVAALAACAGGVLWSARRIRDRLGHGGAAPAHTLLGPTTRPFDPPPPRVAQSPPPRTP